MKQLEELFYLESKEKITTYYFIPNNSFVIRKLPKTFGRIKSGKLFYVSHTHMLGYLKTFNSLTEAMEAVVTWNLTGIPSRKDLELERKKSRYE